MSVETILFVNKYFYLKGGAETVFFQERNFLLEKGCDVIDFSTENAANQISPTSHFFLPETDFNGRAGGMERMRQGLAFVHSGLARKKMEEILRFKKPQIAHLHNIYHHLTPSILAPLKKHGVKVVLTLHDYKLICPGYLALNHGEICDACGGDRFFMPLLQHCQDSRLNEMLLAVEALVHKWLRSYENVDLFLAPSQFIENIVSQRIPREKIRVLRNGINVHAYQAHFADDGYGLYFGRIAREKGVRTLLRAHALEPSFPLKIAGTGPLQEELAAAYPHAEFLGYKTGDELKNLVDKAAFVVVPSEWYENCSMAVLEAMALGKPVIGSRVGGIPEQVEDGVSGFLFEMGNVEELAAKMSALATNKGLRAEFGRRARAKLEREYSLEDHCRQLLAIYQELLAPGRRRPWTPV